MSKQMAEMTLKEIWTENWIAALKALEVQGSVDTSKYRHHMQLTDKVEDLMIEILGDEALPLIMDLIKEVAE